MITENKNKAVNILEETIEHMDLFETWLLEQVRTRNYKVLNHADSRNNLISLNLTVFADSINKIAGLKLSNNYDEE